MTTRTISHLKKYWRAYFVALVGILISFGLFFSLQMEEDRQVLGIAQLGVETLNSHLQAELKFNVHLMKHITGQTPSDLKTAKAPAALPDLLRNYPQWLAAAYIASDHQITWLASLSKASDYRPLFAQFLHNQAGKLSSTKKLWISSPIMLPHQKSGFFMVVPNPYALTEKQQAQDYMLVLIDCESLIHQQTQISGLSLNVYINHVLINMPDDDNEAPATGNWLFDIKENLYGAEIEIKAKQSSYYVGIVELLTRDVSLFWITFILGLVTSIILARSIALSTLLKERTTVLDQINKDLKNEITNHIQTEASKKTLEKALLQGQKLQAIGTLAGGIAHDFNNLLYAIRGYVELARDDISQESITFKNLGKVLEATQRGQDLIAQILTFSRRQQHEFKPIYLKAEIEGAMALLRPTVPQTVDIQFQASTDGKMMGNKTQVHQVIVNLINNAVDAMDGEGTIKIMLTAIAGTEVQHSKMSPLKMNNYCKLDISDTGHGMDQSTMDRVFEPFFTTKEVGKGTGLGLSTVHSIVKDHLGEIIINSRMGQGTTFTIFFPEREELTEEP